MSASAFISLLIVAGVAVGLVLTVLLRDVFLVVWKQGYDCGRKAEAESWVKCGQQAEDAVREIGGRR